MEEARRRDGQAIEAPTCASLCTSPREMKKPLALTRLGAGRLSASPAGSVSRPSSACSS